MTKKANGYALATKKEQDAFDGLKELFMNGDSVCVACVVENYWDVPVSDRDYFVYERKARKILRFLKGLFRKTDANSLKVFSDRPDGIKLTLRALYPCEAHSKFLGYKIMDSAGDYRKFDVMMRRRIGVLVGSHNRILGEGTQTFLELRKEFTKEKVEVGLLKGGSK